MPKPVVFITGALTGIGRAVAEAYAAENAKIVVTGRHLDKGNDLVARLKEIGAAHAIFLKLDVRRHGRQTAIQPLRAQLSAR